MPRTGILLQFTGKEIYRSAASLWMQWECLYCNENTQGWLVSTACSLGFRAVKLPCRCSDWSLGFGTFPHCGVSEPWLQPKSKHLHCSFVAAQPKPHKLQSAVTGQAQVFYCGVDILRNSGMALQCGCSHQARLTEVLITQGNE